MSHWTFSLIRNWDDLWHPSNITAWKSLIEESSTAHVFAHPILIKAWCDTYIPLRKISPVFIWGEDKSGNIVFLPLVSWHRNWKHAFTRTIVPMGYSDFDYHHPVFLKPLEDYTDFWQQLFTFIRQELDFDFLQLDGICGEFTSKTNEWEQNEMCPYLDLSHIHSDEQLLNFFSTSLRGDIRRQIRRMEQQGKLSMKIFGSLDNASETFHVFLSEHSRRWPKAYKAPSFHWNLLKHGLQDGLVHFSALCINDEPIAWHLGFVYNKRFYYYMPVGKSDYSSFSPAKIHLYYLVKWSIEHNIDVFDHLRGDETYKSGWSNGHQYVYSTSLENESMAYSIKKVLLRLRTYQ